jgi:HEAT repeat protein
MAIDVLTKWLHEPRALVPLLWLAQSNADAHRLMMAARGLGWLGDRTAAPTLARLLRDPQQSFVVRVAAAQSLGLLGGALAKEALEKALADARPSVVRAAAEALERIN